MKRALLLSCLFFVFGTSSLWAKQDVVLIHGYGNFFNNDSWGTQAMAKVYWAFWETNAFPGVNVKSIVWDSKRRVNDQMKDIVAQYKAFLKAGHCSGGCVVFTHSTGGLVVDMLMSQAVNSKGSANDFYDVWKSTTAVVEVASAGGGVELAVLAGDIVGGACTNFVLAKAIQTVFPFVTCGKIETLGAGYDLQPNVARSINGSDNIRVPALMIAGYGNMVGNIIKPFLLGTSDGLVPMHSACGGNKAAAYTSCNKDLGPDGLVATQTAPTLYKDHYPYIMTGEGHGSELAPGLANTDILNTFSQSEALVDNYGYSNITTVTKTTGFWAWKKTYRNITDDKRHLSTIIKDHFRF